MKRSGTLLQEPLSRKKYFVAYQKDEELPFKLKLLRNWKLAPEASRYLSKQSNVE
jgi:hypothetical protein